MTIDSKPIRATEIAEQASISSSVSYDEPVSDPGIINAPEENALMNKKLEDDNNSDIERQALPPLPSQTERPSMLSDLDKGLVGWNSEDDPENPYNWPKRRKTLTLTVVLITAFMVPVGSTLIAPGEQYIAKEYNVTNAITRQITVSGYVLGFGWGPLLHAPLSEMYGRKYVIAASNFLLAVLSIGCSESHNISIFLAFRVLSGIMGCAGMVVGAGTISDMYRPNETGTATAMFLLGPIMGPVMGPIWGGFIAQRAGWRWSIRVLEILAFTMTLAMIFVVSETNPSVLLRKKANRLRKETGNNDLQSIIDSRQPVVPPLRKFVTNLSRAARLLVTSPIVLAFALYMSLAYAYMYVFFTTISTVLTERYGFAVETAGLAYISVGCGTYFATIAVGSTNDKLVEYLTAKNGGVRIPEYRLGPMVVGSILLPASLFWYGWSVQAHAHWVAVVIAMFPMGAGLISSLLPIQAYLIDLYGPLGVAASATAGMNLLRCTAAALIPLSVPRLIARLDYGWGYSLFGFLGILLCTTTSLIFVKFGKAFRMRYPPHA
ncbi:major facilitator superfamily domain-containing protein [Lipomyces japonicus]|uniref:major facilitator superfamily domain-containing protein n=1 Tax=Lipomyces japonicus TaxID=56871 RepID=UPI0034CE2DE8